MAFVGEAFATSFQPKDAGREQRVDAGLNFRSGNGRDSNGLLSLPHDATHMHGAEGML